MFQGFSASGEWRDAATSFLPPSSCPHIGPGPSLALPRGRTLLHLARVSGLGLYLCVQPGAAVGACAVLHDSGPCICPGVLGEVFRGRALLPLFCSLPSCLRHTAACRDCRGCPMPGAGSCGLLPPAVPLLLSNVTSSRVWMELEGEGGLQMVHFHTLGKGGDPLYLPYEGSESASPSAQCHQCCWRDEALQQRWDGLDPSGL